jgi:hypothetical protein
MSRQMLFHDPALREGLTLREMVGRLSAARGHPGLARPQRAAASAPILEPQV